MVLISPVNRYMLFGLITSMIASLTEAQPPLLRQSSCMVDTDFRNFSPEEMADVIFIHRRLSVGFRNVASEA
jgi:hypothetical protein